MIEIDPVTLGLEFGLAAVLGGIIGLATKRIAKLLAVIVGVQLVIFRYLESQGIVIVDWEALSAGLFGAGERAEASVLESLLSTVSVGAGFLTGFAIGYHRG